MAYALSQFTQTPTSFSGGIEIRAHVEPNAAQTGGVGFFLPTGIAGATATGYMFVFDPRSGQYPGQIFKMTAGALVALTSITAKGATNAAALSGVHMLLARYHFNTKKFEIWIDGVLQYVGTDSVYTLAGPIAYGGYLATGGFISQVTVNGHSGIHPDNKDPNDKAYIDFTQAGHTGKNLDNIPDGSARKLSAAAGHITTIFPSAVVDASGGYIDVTNVQATGTALPGTVIETADAWSGNTRIVMTFKIPTAGNLNLFFFDPSNNAYVVQVGAVGVTIRKSTAAGVRTNPTTYSGDYTATDFSNTTRTVTVQFHSNGKIAVHVGGVQRATATETLYTFNGGIGYALEAAGTGFIYKVLIEGHTAIHPDNQDINQRAIIDFTQAGHISKDLDHIADGATYARILKSASNGNLPLHKFQKLFPTAVVDADGRSIDTPGLGISATTFGTSSLVISAAGYAGVIEAALRLELVSATASGQFAFAIYTGSGGVGINGYLFNIAFGSGLNSWTVYRVDNGVLTALKNGAANGSNLAAGIYDFGFIYYPEGKMDLYYNGLLVAAGSTTAVGGLPTLVDATYTGTMTLGYASTAAMATVIKIADADFSLERKIKASAHTNGVPKKDILHLFPTAVMDDDGVRLDVLNAIG